MMILLLASVSCIYGIGDPNDYKDSMLNLRVNEQYNRKELYKRLIEMQFERNDIDFKRGSFRVRGDVLEIIPISEHSKGLRIEFFDDEIERIRTFDVTTGKAIEDVMFCNVFAATHFVTNKQKLEEAIRRIKEELGVVQKKFIKEGKPLEAERIEQRTKYDIEMLEQTGFCSGIENYSRHLALRNEGETPATLIDFFPENFFFTCKPLNGYSLCFLSATCIFSVDFFCYHYYLPLFKRIPLLLPFCFQDWLSISAPVIHSYNITEETSAIAFQLMEAVSFITIFR